MEETLQNSSSGCMHKRAEGGGKSKREDPNQAFPSASAAPSDSGRSRPSAPALANSAASRLGSSEKPTSTAVPLLITPSASPTEISSSLTKERSSSCNALMNSSLRSLESSGDGGVSRLFTLRMAVTNGDLDTFVPIAFY